MQVTSNIYIGPIVQIQSTPPDNELEECLQESLEHKLIECFYKENKLSHCRLLIPNVSCYPDTLDIMDDILFQNIDSDLISAHLEEFEKVFDTEIDYLYAKFGEDKVNIFWGIVRDGIR